MDTITPMGEVSDYEGPYQEGNRPSDPFLELDRYDPGEIYDNESLDHVDRGGTTRSRKEEAFDAQSPLDGDRRAVGGSESGEFLDSITELLDIAEDEGGLGVDYDIVELFGPEVARLLEELALEEAMFDRGDATVSILGLARQIKGGWDDFRRNRDEMIRVGWKGGGGGDKYYHCMANFEAARRGLGGEVAAIILSYGREWTDFYRNFYTDVTREFYADAVKDMAANFQGFVGGRRARKELRCFDACKSLRPPGMENAEEYGR